MRAVDIRLGVQSRLRLLGLRPIRSRPLERSLIAPPDGQPSERLLDVTVRAIELARSVDLRWIADRSDGCCDAWKKRRSQMVRS